MSAVATKHRGKAKAVHAKPTPEKRLADIESRLALGRKKLSLASESAELTCPGEALDVLLLHVIETMLPEALLPLDARPITAEAMEAAYTGMFPSLAAIEAVLRLTDGKAIEPLVREALALLDAANSDMDFGDMPNALPRAGEIKTEAVCAASLSAVDETPDPYCLMHQALEVARAAASNNGASDMHHGLYSLIEAGMRHVGRAQDAVNAKEFSEDLHNKASNELAGLLGVLRAANNDAVDDSLLYAVETLVVVSKEKLDRKISEALQ